MKYRIVTLIIAATLFQSCNISDGSDSKTMEYASKSNVPELKVFEAPTGAPANSTFEVYVRYEGGRWINLHEYDAAVDGGYLKTPVHHMSFVSFDSDFSREIEVKIIKNEGEVREVKIRPEIDGIEPVIEGNVIRFFLSGSHKLSIEVNGDLHNNLMVFANKPETETIDTTDTNLHYFGPGIHKIGGDGRGTLALESGQEVYISGGAIVYGSISAFGAENVLIKGRGILSGGMYTDHAYPHEQGKGLISFLSVRNAEIDGVILLNTVGWNIHLYGCRDIICNDLKIMGWTINSDGINPQCSSNILIDNCFVRNYDDCVSIKMNYGSGEWSNNNSSCDITVQDCVFWTDQGRAILIGPESHTPKDNIFENITVRNVDVLYNENYDVDWAKGVLAINLGDDAIARNIIFEDIRVDSLGPKTNLISLTMDKYTYNISEARRIENIHFNRISLNSGQNLNNRILGFDTSRMISAVCFSDLKINDGYIENAAEGNFDINEFSEDILFTTSYEESK